MSVCGRIAHADGVAVIYYGMKINEIPDRVHFVGVGGVGQSSLALHLVGTGRKVSGSDRQASNVTDKLRQSGVCVHIGHDAANVGNAQLVVRTSAVGCDNVEVEQAIRQGVPVVLREELLGAIVNDFNIRIAISGTHGKTTTTAWVHYMLQRCGVDHAAFIGGMYGGSNYFCGRNVVVCEACEYNKSFMNLRPSIAVCLNAEFDHPDCYRDKQAAMDGFADFVALAGGGVAVLPVSLAPFAVGQAVLFGSGGDVSAENVTLRCGKPSFDLVVRGKKVARVKLRIPGAHNVDNALAVAAVALALDLPMLQVAAALCTFCGVERRWTERDGICRVVTDYAHHPTEIAAAVATAKSMAKHTVCVFQPHTFSRTKAFMIQFAECFSGVSVVYLPVFAARESPIDGVDSVALCRIARSLGIDAYCAADFAEAAATATKLVTSSRDILLLLGAGNVCDMAEMFCK